MASNPRSATTRAERALKAPGTMTPRRAWARALSCCLVFMNCKGLICYCFCSYKGLKDGRKRPKNSKNTARHTHPAFHQDAGAAAHQGLGHLPLAVDLRCIGPHTQGA